MDPKLNCRATSCTQHLLKVTLNVSGRCCGAELLSQAAHISWLDPGPCIISSMRVSA